jgi:hypothetical protein
MAVRSPDRLSAGLLHGRIVEAPENQLRSFCLEKRDAIYLHLDLEAPTTAALVPIFGTMGFLFAGVLPRALAGRDALILHYLNNIAIDYDRIKPFSEDGAHLLAYVQHDDPGLQA